MALEFFAPLNLNSANSPTWYFFLSALIFIVSIFLVTLGSTHSLDWRLTPTIWSVIGSIISTYKYSALGNTTSRSVGVSLVTILPSASCEVCLSLLNERMNLS